MLLGATAHLGLGRCLGREAGFSAAAALPSSVEMTIYGRVQENGQQQEQNQIQGFFAALRMTTQNEQLQKQIPFGDDN